MVADNVHLHYVIEMLQPGNGNRDVAAFHQQPRFFEARRKHVK